MTNIYIYIHKYIDIDIHIYNIYLLSKPRSRSKIAATSKCPA
jgi:hypothetical protein